MFKLLFNLVQGGSITAIYKCLKKKRGRENKITRIYYKDKAISFLFKRSFQLKILKIRVASIYPTMFLNNSE